MKNKHHIFKKNQNCNSDLTVIHLVSRIHYRELSQRKFRCEPPFIFFPKCFCCPSSLPKYIYRRYLYYLQNEFSVLWSVVTKRCFQVIPKLFDLYFLASGIFRREIWNTSLTFVRVHHPLDVFWKL